MIIGLAVILLFIWLSRKDFNKAVLLFAIVNPLLNAGLAIKYSPPAITVSFFLSLYFFCVFCLRREQYFDKHFFPLRKSFLLLGIAYSVSAIYGLLDGNMSSLTGCLRDFFSIYITAYLVWVVCKTNKEVRFFVKTSIIVYSIIFAYGLFEYYIQSNPIMDYLSILIPEEFMAGKINMKLNFERSGRIRLQSLFHICILYGTASVLFLFFITYIKKYTLNIIHKRYFFLLIAFALFAIYASNSKTPVLGCAICAMALIKNTRSAIVSILILGFVIVYPDLIMPSLNKIIDFSSFDLTNDDMTGGSSLYMRILQFQSSVEALKQSPIIGNGYGYTSVWKITHPEILGAESIWFKLLIDQGMLGIIAFASIIKECVKICLSFTNKRIVWFVVSFFTMVTMTDLGFQVFYCMFVVLIRMESLDFINSKRRINTCLLVHSPTARLIDKQK